MYEIIYIRMNNIWHNLPRPFTVLAPMEAVTDTVFRHVIRQAASPDLYFTEFTNATGWAHAGDRAIGTRLIKSDDESPIIAQIWGGDPASMAGLAAHCRDLGYDGIDINMGCPAKTAIKSGGAALIRNPQLAAEAIASAKTAGLPVSVKTRLGYTHTDEWRDWLGHLLAQDIVNLTIHLRTKREMSKVPAHYELIPAIKQLRDERAPHTLLTINGDIRDRVHGEELAGTYGIDGVMIGRGVFHNPFAFESAPRPHDRKELFALLRLHLDLFDAFIVTHGDRPYEPLKRFFKIYVRDFDGASELRDRLMHTKSTAEVRAVLAAHK